MASRGIPKEGAKYTTLLRSMSTKQQQKSSRWQVRKVHLGSKELQQVLIVCLFYTLQYIYVSPRLSAHPLLVSIHLFSASVSLFLLCKQVHLYQTVLKGSCFINSNSATVLQTCICFLSYSELNQEEHKIFLVLTSLTNKEQLKKHSTGLLSQKQYKVSTPSLCRSFACQISREF